jgi:hypothetical protein
MILQKAYKRIFLAVVFCFCTQSSFITTRAQTTLGGITGEVSDASGNVVSAAHVTITSNGTGLTRDTTSNTTGSYAFRDLPVGA